jgi:hypothetical protein
MGGWMNALEVGGDWRLKDLAQAEALGQKSNAK